MTYTIIFHILVPVLLACMVNGYIYFKGWNSEAKDSKNSLSKNPLLPPGYVIAIVWVIILSLLGYAHYLTTPQYSSWVIIIAIAYCLSYPFLTLGLQSKMSLFNALALIFSIAVTATCYATVIEATPYTIPFLLWTVYVNIATNAYDLGLLS